MRGAIRWGHQEFVAYRRGRRAGCWNTQPRCRKGKCRHAALLPPSGSLSALFARGILTPLFVKGGISTCIAFESCAQTREFSLHVYPSPRGGSRSQAKSLTGEVAHMCLPSKGEVIAHMSTPSTRGGTWKRAQTKALMVGKMLSIDRPNGDGSAFLTGSGLCLCRARRNGVRATSRAGEDSTWLAYYVGAVVGSRTVDRYHPKLDGFLGRL